MSTPSASAVLPATECPLNALADVAANLFISLPDSPQGKPFIDRADAGSPASLLRAMRRRLNLTQREFGILLSPLGANPISPSVICQLESALQSVPPALVSRAIAATTAAQRLGEYLCGRPQSKAADAASALKVLGPGCIDELQPYLDANAELTPEERSLVREFLAIVTKRRHSTGGSRPGARGPYRKLSKLSQQKGAVEEGVGTPTTTSAAAADPSAAVSAFAPASCDATESPRAHYSPRCESETVSGRSTPCSTPGSTPGSSRGSSRPRSPTSYTGYDSQSGRSETDYASSPALTPGGTVSELAQRMGLNASGSEVSLDVLMALRRLQEENEALQQENKRLKSMAQQTVAEVAAEPAAEPVLAPATVAAAAPALEISRVDVGMSC